MANPGVGSGPDGGPAGDFAVASTQYYEIASDARVQTGNVRFTFFAVVKARASANSILTILGKDNSTAGNREYILVYDVSGDQRLYMYVSRPTDALVSADTGAGASAPKGIWHSVFGWHDAAAATVNIQDNGQVYSTATGGALQAAGSAPLRIGADGYPGFVRPFDGQIACVFLWRRVLSALERAQISTQPYAMFAAPAWRRYFAPAGGRLIRPNPLDGLGSRLRGVA